MKTSMFSAFVIAIACLFSTASALAQSGSGSGPRSGMTSQGLASEPAGIGEKGTGQTQSTLERSGGGAQDAQKGMTSEPAGIGEKGTGQTQNTMERSGLSQGSSSAQGQSQNHEQSSAASQGTNTNQSAMDRPER